MSSKPREWPNVAKEARDRAAEETQNALNEIEELLLRKNFLETERISRMSKAALSLNKALRFLESVGAPTRPI